MAVPVKQQVIEMIERLPDDASLYDILERIYLRVRANELGHSLDPDEIDNNPANRRLAAALRWAMTRRKEELAVLMRYLRAW